MSTSPSTPNAQRVILDLLSAVSQTDASPSNGSQRASEAQGMSVQMLIAGCAVMGVSSNGVRVALSRLKQRNLIASERRGFYELGEAALQINEVVAGWRSVESQVCDWDGAWIAVHSAAVPKRERRAGRVRDRALRLLGFREICRDLHIRPNNFIGGVVATRGRLHALGLDPRELVFLLDELDPENAKAAPLLWTPRELESSYQQMIDELDDATRRLRRKPPMRGAREAFTLGGEAIRRIVTDPLLPEPIVDATLRRRFIRTMCAFDTFGRDLWHQALTPAEQAHA